MIIVCGYAEFVGGGYSGDAHAGEAQGELPKHGAICTFDSRRVIAMISRCGLMQKKDGMGMEEFKDYWLNVHGPIASKMANLRKYDQHVVVDAEHRHAIGRGSVVIDGYSELQFDSYGDMVEGVESLHGEGANDVPMFANPHCQILVLASAKSFDPGVLRGRSLPLHDGRADGVIRSNPSKNGTCTTACRPFLGARGYNQDLVTTASTAYPFRTRSSRRRRREMCGSNERSVRRVLRARPAHSSEFIAINYLTETYPVALPSA